MNYKINKPFLWQDKVFKHTQVSGPIMVASEKRWEFGPRQNVVSVSAALQEMNCGTSSFAFLSLKGS
jgi:hypothetical protein